MEQERAGGHGTEIYQQGIVYSCFSCSIPVENFSSKDERRSCPRSTGSLLPTRSLCCIPPTCKVEPPCQNVIMCQPRNIYPKPPLLQGHKVLQLPRLARLLVANEEAAGPAHALLRLCPRLHLPPHPGATFWEGGDTHPIEKWFVDI